MSCYAPIMNTTYSQKSNVPVKGWHKIICKQCKKVFYVVTSVKKRNPQFCSRSCKAIFEPHRYSFPKRYPEGYKRPKYKQKWINNICYLEHRLIMENHIGRKLLTSEHVHHIDGNPRNNEIKNLVILNKSDHHRIEALSITRN